MFQCEGYHDMYNIDLEKLLKMPAVITNRRNQGIEVGDKRIYKPKLWFS